MPVKIGRRPFTDCPMVWVMSNAGLTGLNDFSTGRGDVSNAQCSSLNVGEYPMTYKSCGSDGNVLLWQGECVERQIILPPAPPCYTLDGSQTYCDVDVTIDVPAWTMSAAVKECPLQGDIEPVLLDPTRQGLGCQSGYYIIADPNGSNILIWGGRSYNFNQPSRLLTLAEMYTYTGETLGNTADNALKDIINDATLQLSWPAATVKFDDPNNPSAPFFNNNTPLADGTYPQTGANKDCFIPTASWVQKSIGQANGPLFTVIAAYTAAQHAKFDSAGFASLKKDVVGGGHFVQITWTAGAETRNPYNLDPIGIPWVSQSYLYKTAENLYDLVDNCDRTITATLVSNGDVIPNLSDYASYEQDELNRVAFAGSIAYDVAPKEVTLTAKVRGTATIISGYVGPDPGDRLKATWSLEYDIQEQLWTLHSFEQIENPIYTLRDTNPCCGNSKVLTRVQNIGAQGCDISPETITISRGGDYFGGEVRRRTNIRSVCPRTTKRAACDCQDNVIDYRAATVAKCVDITTPGCEDYGDDVKTRFPKNQLHCPSCDRNSPCDPFLPEFVDVPCSYEALFGSGIGGKPPCNIIHDNTEIASGVVTMRQRCRFTNPCEWVAVGPSAEPLDGAVGHDPYCVLCAQFAVGSCASNCTWEAVQAGVCIPGSRPALLKPVINILKKLGTSWHLNVAGDATTLEYNHPSFGMITYRVDQMEPFLCDNVNTFYLTAQGELPDGVMPESICVRPRYSGCGGSMTYDVKSDAYEEVEDQIACCDPACGSIGPIPITVRCCFSLERCEATFTAQTTLLGRDSPAGPSYLGSCTLHGVLWTGVIYCDGVRWKTDWYCKSPREFFVTTTHTHTCCPLTLSVEYWPDNFGGVKCCPVQECQCCDTTGTDYDTLEMSITFSAACAADMFAALCTFSRPVTMTLTMTRVFNSTSSWQYILCDNDYGMDMFVSCLNGVWTFDWNFAGTPPFPLLIANCDNKTGSVTATNSALCPAILLEWTNPITCPENGSCTLVTNITITS